MHVSVGSFPVYTKTLHAHLLMITNTPQLSPCTWPLCDLLSKLILLGLLWWLQCMCQKSNNCRSGNTYLRSVTLSMMKPNDTASGFSGSILDCKPDEPMDGELQNISVSLCTEQFCNGYKYVQMNNWQQCCRYHACMYLTQIKIMKWPT